MTTNSPIHWTKRIALLTTTGALALAPLLVTSDVQAQPRRYSPPGWNNGNWNNGHRTLSGTVVRDLAGDTFELRAENGQTYRIRVGRYDEPRSLDRGDRVRVSGQFRDGLFIASNLEFLRDTGNNNDPRGLIWLTGTVTRDLSGDEFELRADNNRLYRIRVGRFDEPRSLDRGDRVRLSGHLRDNVFVARNLEFLRDTDNNNSPSWLTGTITRDLSGNSFELRIDNGRVYRVTLARYDEPRSLDRGDRVRVTGRLVNNVFVARDLELLRDTRR